MLKGFLRNPLLKPKVRPFQRQPNKRDQLNDLLNIQFGSNPTAPTRPKNQMAFQEQNELSFLKPHTIIKRCSNSKRHRKTRYNLKQLLEPSRCVTFGLVFMNKRMFRL